MSEITYYKNGELASLTGDAMELYRVAILCSAIGLLEHGIQPTRGFTMKKALAQASILTGQVYKRTESERAKSDLHNWIELMKSTIPTRTL